jgi:integrase
VATHERYLAVRAAVQKLAAGAKSKRTRLQWVRMELALLLVEATGRRIGAVRWLRWEDIAREPPAITWRKEFDKRRREQTIPIPASLADEIRALRAKLGAFGDGWLFPQSVGDHPWHRKRFDALMRRAEEETKVPKLDGGLWHCYRRKWATKRRHLPAVDVIRPAAGRIERRWRRAINTRMTAGVLAAMESPVSCVSETS